MPTATEDYKGLVVITTPGGFSAHIEAQTKALADRIGPCLYVHSGPPNADYDDAATYNAGAGPKFYPGSVIYDTSADPPVVWRCLSNGTGAAEWGMLSPSHVIATTEGVASPRLISPNESGVTFTNEGATEKNYYDLPSAKKGLLYTFVIADSDGIRAVAATGDTIRNAAVVTPAAGYIEATTVGNVVTLLAINATEWIAINVVGTWTLSS